MVAETVADGRTKIFDRDHLPKDEEFREYRKLATTLAAKVPGTMKVVTREGIIQTDNGWLAIDANGWPYPIADDVFQSSYEAVEDGGQDDQAAQEIDRLARFILTHVPGEPSQSESAVDTAIRLISASLDAPEIADTPDE